MSLKNLANTIKFIENPGCGMVGGWFMSNKVSIKALAAVLKDVVPNSICSPGGQ